MKKSTSHSTYLISYLTFTAIDIVLENTISDEEKVQQISELTKHMTELYKLDKEIEKELEELEELEYKSIKKIMK